MRVAIVLVLFFPSLFIRSQEQPSLSEIRMETAIEKVGDYGQFAPAATALVALLVHKDEEGGWQFIKSFGTNLILTHTIKYAVNKPRPEGRTDGRAFPSGHTSTAFQGASFLQRRYGWQYGVPAYLMAGFVGYSRMEGYNDRHDGWDVLAGAIVGIGSTYLFTTPYQREHLELTFTNNDQGYLIGLNYRF